MIHNNTQLKRFALGTVLGIVSSFAFMATQAMAHVGYVLDDTAVAAKGSDLVFLLSSINDEKNLLLVLVVGLAVAGIWIAAQHTPQLARFLSRVQARAGEYETFVPWIMRLSLGIALLGAGASGALISPIAKASPMIAQLELLLGFFLLAGFFTGLSALGALVLYAMALGQSSYFLGGLDVLALGVGILATSSARPGIDDLFGVPFFPTLVSFRKYLPVVLRAGVGIGMIYLALYEKLLNPHFAAAVVEKYHLTSVIPASPALWVLGTGVIELALGCMLLAGFRVRLVSAAAIAVLSLSFFYFKEGVYAHVTLFGILSAIFVTGSGSRTHGPAHRKPLVISKIRSAWRSWRGL